MILWMFLFGTIAILFIVLMMNWRFRVWMNKTMYNMASNFLDIAAIKNRDVKLKIELTDKLIRHEYVEPDNSERAWNENDYANGCVFIKGKANPIKHNRDGKLIPTKEYQEKIDQAVYPAISKAIMQLEKDPFFLIKILSGAILVITILILFFK